MSISLHAGSNCTDGELRLAGGKIKTEGRLEVCLNDLWATVCAERRENWQHVSAAVVCRQLGYASGA